MESFDDVLDLEQSFYAEGYNAGLADGHTAGLIEGRTFGIEKGYEKALEMGRIHGRALVWNQRLPQTISLSSTSSAAGPEDQNSSNTHGFEQDSSLAQVASNLAPLAGNLRLRKHVETLLETTEGSSLSADNDDQAVAEFEDRIARASAKAKVVSQIVGEPFNPTKAKITGIEESKGLSARH